MDTYDGRHPSSSGVPVREEPVGSAQGSAAGIADESGIEPGSPPRLAGYPEIAPVRREHPEEPAAVAPGGGLYGERTGEQSFLPPGSEPGERGGPALIGARDLREGPRLEPPSEAATDATRGPTAPRREEPMD